MPAQRNQNKTRYYAEFDTAPPLQRCLLNGNEEPFDLSGAVVTVSISYAMRQGGFVLFPRDLIVYEGVCDIEDQETMTGWVSWWPQENDLTPSGRYNYTFEITWQNGAHQTVPPNTFLPMVIQPKIGGPLVQGGASSSTTHEQTFPPASP
ncbi:MAG: hypothetical protein DRQ40_01740 [Gammaproteobacteria bacterium]|nr:MAG: hypothetical protein DRQ40_01740 [Gammaproteobacteria bacterium]